jgi:formate hydrogenlyase subunit 4
MTTHAMAALAALLVLAPALPALAAKTTARLTGRRGAPVHQLYLDLLKLVRKGSVYGDSTTWIFRLAPLLLVGTCLVAALLLPLDGRRAPIAFAGDLLAFAALLALGRFAFVLAGLDTGSSFEGMGASRDLAFSSLVEPGLFLSLTALALATGQLSISGMMGAPLADVWAQAAATIAMVAASLFILLTAEAGRGPVDDPATHLELTMIHEVTALDHGGLDLAFVLYGGALKFALFAALVVGVLAPRAWLGGPFSLAILVAGLAAVSVLVGVVESVMARLRLGSVSRWLLLASALPVLGILLRMT